MVELRGEPRGSTTTDADGKYVFNDIRPGFYTLSAALNSFRTEQTARLLTRGEHVWDVGLALGRVVDTQPHRMSGVVLTSDQKPIPNATVSLWSVFSPAQLRQTRTDAQGRFSLETMDAGQFLITAVKSGYDAQCHVVVFRRADEADVALQFELRLGKQH